ncbi:tRNA pseudouridine(38-40) synthase TruA [Nocardioides sp. CN2-186]|uniref:tRNA pseudouridine(38-40) synthase TruA n=1 Tax=Nocardioides tweenelious TaxID=3156607 RepID=UPI0032B3DFD9
MRLRIDLAYDGTDFRGWAVQPGLRTVQGELQDALATVLRIESAAVVCAGRTDAGVHARAQVVHVDLDDPPAPEWLLRRLNGILPADVRVRRVVAAPEGFDARFGALWRRYAYRIADDAAYVDPLMRAQVLAWPRPLDERAMNAAALLLVGRHDFASFCKQREGATTIRTLLELSWTRDETGLLVGTVVADAFCHSMVRALVGCLISIGEGRQPVDWADDVLRAELRNPGVVVVHAHGLTLEEVAYPADDELTARAVVTRAKRESDD